MSFTLTTIPFDPQHEPLFWQRLARQSQHHLLLSQLLNASDSQFQQKLMQIDEGLMRQISISLSRQSKVAVVSLFFKRLNCWHPEKIEDGRKVAEKLLTVQQQMCGTKFAESEMVVYLMQKLREMKSVIELLQQKILDQFFQVDESTQYHQVKLRVQTFLEELFQSLAQGRKNYRDMVIDATQGQRLVFMMKVVKIYSWIFGEKQTQKFQLEGLVSRVKKEMTRELLEEFVQIKHKKCYEEVAKVMHAILEFTPDGFRWAKSDEVDKNLITDSLFEKIFRTSNKIYPIFRKQRQSEKEKEVVFRYNFMNFTGNALTNIFPHDLDDSKYSIEKKGQIVLDLFKEIFELLGKLKAQWRIHWLSYEQGEVKCVRLEDQVPSKIYQFCVKFLFILVRYINEGPNKIRNMLLAFFIRDKKMPLVEMKHAITTILEFQNFNKVQDEVYVIDKIAYILLEIRKFCRPSLYKETIQKNKPMNELLIQKIDNIFSYQLEQSSCMFILILILEQFDSLKDIYRQKCLLENKPVYLKLFCQCLKGQTEVERCLKAEKMFFYGYTLKFTFINDFFKDIREKASQFIEFREYIDKEMLKLLKQIKEISSRQLTEIEESKVVFLLNYFAYHDGQLKEETIQDILVILKQKMVAVDKIDPSDLGALVKMDKVEQFSKQLKNISKFLKNQSFREYLIDQTSIGDLKYSDIKDIMHSSRYFEVLAEMLKPQEAQNLEKLISDVIELIHSLVDLKVLKNQKMFQNYSTKQLSDLISMKADFQKFRLVMNFSSSQKMEEIDEIISNILKACTSCVSKLKDDKLIEGLKKISCFLDETGVLRKKEYVECLSEIIQNKKNQSHISVGPALLSCEYHKIENIVKDCYRKNKESAQRQKSKSSQMTSLEQPQKVLDFILQKKGMNQKQLSQEYQNGKQTTLLSTLNDFIDKLYAMNQNTQHVYINDKKYTGNKILSRVQKSIYIFFLTEQLKTFDASLMRYYHFLISRISSCENNFRTRSQLRQEESQSSSNFQAVEIPILNEKTCDLKLQSSKLAFIEKLLLEKVDQKPEKDILNKLIVLLLKNVNQGQKVQKVSKSILLLMIESLNNLLEKNSFDRQQYLSELQFFNTFAKDKSLTQVLSVNFVENFLRFIKKMIEDEDKTKFKEQLEASMPLLQKLLPHQYDVENRQILITYAKSIAYMIVQITKISDKKIKQNDSILQKIIKSKNKAIKNYIPFFLQKIGNNSFADYFCFDLSSEYEEMAIQLDIKGYFLIKSENQIDSQFAQTSISDLSFRFRRKYQKSIPVLTKMLKKYTWKKIINEQNLQCIKILFDKEQKFDESDCLKDKFLSFKPSLAFAFMFKNKVQEIMKSPETYGSFLKELRKVLEAHSVLLPFVLFSPIFKQSGKNLLQILFEKCLQVNNKNLKEFLFWVCLDHSSIVKGIKKQWLIADAVCYFLVQKFLSMEMNISNILLILYFCEIKRFCKYCRLSLDGQTASIQTRFKSIVVSTVNSDKISIKKKLLCSFGLSLFYRHEFIQNLSGKTIPDLKKSYYDFLMTEFCCFPFDGIIKNTSAFCQQRKKRQFIGLLKEQFEEVKRKVEKQYEQWSIPEEMPLLTEMENVKITDEIIKHIGVSLNVLPKRRFNVETFCEIGQKYSTFISELSIFNNESEQPSISSDFFFYPKPINVTLQDEEDSYQKEVEEKLFLLGMVEDSRYALADYNTGHLILNQQQGWDEDESHQHLVEILLNCIQDLPKNGSREIKVEDKSVEIKQVQIEKQLSAEAEELVKNIDKNYQELGRLKFDVKELKNMKQNDIEEYLKQRWIESDFDLKQQTLKTGQFQQYCLANVTKLQKLPKQKRKKVTDIEEQILQLAIRRKNSSDSLDYVIDTIDENYQLLNENSSGKQKTSVFDNQKPKKIQSKYLNIEEISDSDYPQVDEELLLALFQSIYENISDFNYFHLLVFLENKKYQDKIVNTLLLIARNPFGVELFPRKMKKEDQDGDERIDKESTRIRKIVIQLLINFYAYSLYQNDGYLLQETSKQCLKQVILPSFDKFEEKIWDKPIYELLWHALPSKKEEENEEKEDENSQNQKQINIDLSLKIRMLRGIDSFPDILMERIMKIVDELRQYLDPPRDEQIQDFQYMKWRNQFDLKYNLRQICKFQPFRKQMTKKYPLSDENINIGFIAYFIEHHVFDSEELKKLFQKVLEKEQHQSEDTFFLSEVLRVFSDEELNQLDWSGENMKKYEKVLQKFMKNTRTTFFSEQCYRLMASANFVQSLSFDIKVGILKAEILYFKQLQNLDNLTPTIYAQRKRGIFESAFQNLRFKPDKFWQSQFSCRFMSENGQIQTGYGSGVEKDWYTLVTSGMVNLNYGLFTKSSKNYYFFNRESWINPRHLQFFEFIGKLFALSFLKNDYYLIPSFSSIIYKIILGQEIQVDDLIEEFDEGESIKNVEKLRQFTDDSMFWQTFIFEDVRVITEKKINKVDEIEKQNSNFYLLKEATSIKNIDLSKKQEEEKIIKTIKVGQTIELVPGGAQMQVKLANLEQYIELIKKKIYDVVINSVQKQISAFMNGFESIMDKKLLKKFSHKELRCLAEGLDQIPVSALKSQTSYENRVKVDDKEIVWFWQIFEELPSDDKAYFIQHWTGTPKLPVQNIKDMNLTIGRGMTNDKRIFSQTCFNKIQLPTFDTKEELKNGMLEAIALVQMGLSKLEDN